jgi:hypothetical protein
MRELQANEHSLINGGTTFTDTPADNPTPLDGSVAQNGSPTPTILSWTPDWLLNRVMPQPPQDVSEGDGFLPPPALGDVMK